MSPRTLQNWLQDGAHEPKLGRPRYAPVLVRRALRAVREAMKKLGGLLSWRTVCRELGTSFPVRLVQRLVAHFKRQRERRHQAHLEAQRVHIEVLAAGAMWSQDATYLAQDEQGNKVWAEHLRDVASAECVHLVVGGELCGEEVVAMLEQVRKERGSLPLVLSTDNGSAYKSAAVSAYLHEQQIVHLKNLPRTPQHNPWIERGQGELKRALAIDPGQEPSHGLPRSIWNLAVQAARKALNTLLPRPSREGKTAAQASQELRRQYDAPYRARFYEAACAAHRRALLELDRCAATKRAKRLAEREAILATMELFGLIQRTRGGALLEASKHAIIS